MPQSYVLTGLATLLALVVLRWIVLVTYNIFFHPLAKYPGPLLSTASYLPQFAARGKGNIQYIKTLHDRYGPVVRIAPNELSFTNPQAWKDIYGHVPGQKQLPKQIIVDQPDLVLKAPHLILAPDQAHSRMRRNLAHAFSAGAVQEQEYLLHVHFENLVDRTRQQAKSSPDNRVDMEKMFNCVAFDIIGDLAFGESFGALDQYEYHSFMVGVFRNLKVFSQFQRLSVYPWALKAMGTMMQLIPAAVEGRVRHFKFAAERVNERIARDTDRKDFMWYIIKNNGKEGRGLSPEEIVSNSGLMIGAGSETTATALTGTLYYLLRTPNAMQKLTEEVRNAFTSGADFNIASVSKLTYLAAVMEEGMRLCPSGPGANVRITNVMTIIDGNIVPPGVRVGVQAYTTHRSESNFHHAGSFVPERWLPDADPEYKNDRRDAAQPFSYGPRNCLGKSLAYAEMYSIMARIIYHFDMKLCDESKAWMEQPAFIHWEKSPLWVKITPRD